MPSKYAFAVPAVSLIALALSGCLASTPATHPAYPNAAYPPPSYPNPAYPTPSYPNTYPSTYPNQIGLDDLRGVRRDHAEWQLNQRGFYRVDDNEWFNAQTGQCVEVKFDDGQLQKIEHRKTKKCRQ